MMRRGLGACVALAYAAAALAGPTPAAAEPVLVVAGNCTYSGDQFAVTGIEGSVYRSELWVAATDGSAPPHRLTDGAADGAPRWSPDGASIAFLRPDAQGRRQLFVMPADGGTARQSTDHPLGVGSPVTARHARAPWRPPFLSAPRTPRA